MELPTPITLPPDWNAQKDFAYFEDRWNPNPSYTEALWDRMRFHYGSFESTITRTLRYLYSHTANCIEIEPSCLSVDEKIEILLGIAETTPAVRPYRQRLLENLRHCQFAESERQRILRAHRLAGEQAWLYPVVEVIDYIGDAAFLINETMCCETTDYKLTGRSYFDDLDDEECPSE